MGLSGIWQAIVVLLIEKKIRLNPLLRSIAFTAPFWILLILPILGIKPERPENKQRPAISANGAYEATVGTFDGIWVVKIEEQATGEIYTEQTDFVAHLNVYWIWDSSDNFWLYNRDDSGVHVWILEDETWKHHEWGWGGERKNENLTIDPPLALLPDYAKSRHQTSEQ